MAFYSFIVNNESGDVVTLPSHYLVLDMGRTAFNARVDDLARFTDTLDTKGVRVLQAFCLDVLGAPQADMLTLPQTGA